MRLEKTAQELQDDLKQIKEELEITIQMKQTLEQEKLNLNAKTDHLQSTLDGLELEKGKIEEALEEREKERELLSVENRGLCEATCDLRQQLDSIARQTAQLLHEKTDIEQKLIDNETKAKELEEEKEYYSFSAKELMATLTDLAAQKEMTEAELKDEVVARINAEKQLRTAEKALEHLEIALKLSGAHISGGLKDQIMPDVDRLKKFFEECAEEARLDANRPIIMKNAIYARKSFLRKCKHRLRSSYRRKTRISSQAETPVTDGMGNDGKDNNDDEAETQQDAIV